MLDQAIAIAILFVVVAIPSLIVGFVVGATVYHIGIKRQLRQRIDSAMMALASDGLTRDEWRGAESFVDRFSQVMGAND